MTDQRMFVEQQGSHGGHSRHRQLTKAKHNDQRDQQPKHHDMKQTRDDQRIPDSEITRQRVQTVAAVVVMILTSVDHVEAADPERHRGGKQQYPRIERATNRDPRGRRSNTKGESKKEMRPPRESLAVRIQEDYRQRQRGERQRQAVQLRRGKNKNSTRNQNECAHERRRQLSDRQSPSCSTRIRSINRGVGQAIERHSGGARRDHGDNDPRQLPPRRHTSGGQHGSAERKREREDRVLPFDHLQRDLEISEDSHTLIVEQRPARSGQWSEKQVRWSARSHR